MTISTVASLLVPGVTVPNVKKAGAALIPLISKTRRPLYGLTVVATIEDIRDMAPV